MHTPTLLWRERQSSSPFIESIWTSEALTNVSRTVIADPCISIAFIKAREGARIVISGARTTVHTENLPGGHTCTTIRLKTGAYLKRVSISQLTNNSVVLEADARGGFHLGKQRLQFPDFDHAEQLIQRLQEKGELGHAILDTLALNVLDHQSARTRSRQSRLHTGLSPYQVFQLRRVHQALRLLKQGMPAAEVATELEFVDQSHLIRASKQFLGHTPRQLSRLPQLP